MSIDKKKMKEHVLPEVVKLEKIGEEIKGEYVSMEESLTFKNSYALRFVDDTDKKTKVCFVNSIGKGSIEDSGLKSGQDFVLRLMEIRKVKDKESDNEYFVYKLWTE